MKTWIACGLLLAAASHVRAEGDDVDVRSFEYVDVIETADGSVWKGVIVEQTPNVSYKIAIAGGSIHVIAAADVKRMSKQRNLEYRGGRPAALRDGGIAQTYEPAPKLPAPYARSGLRLDPELAFVFPTGTYEKFNYKTSFAPGARLGYEALFGNIGLSGGFHARFTYWSLPGDSDGDANWLLETQLYGRAALHVGRAMPDLGLSLGVDTNYLYDDASEMSSTNMGLGMNLSAGVQIAATPLVAFDLGGDYHPGTDTIHERFDGSVSYFALRIGASIRL